MISNAVRDRLFANALEMFPLPTMMPPEIKRLNGIRAVVFDIYGTLLISGSGDIGVDAGDNREYAMPRALNTVGIQVKTNGKNLVGLFVDSVRREQNTRRNAGIEYPEVEIREIWKQFLDEAVLREWIEPVEQTPELREMLAIEFESLTNPVWPMPYMLEVLDVLRTKKLRLGIVSNAQFYTPLLMEFFLQQPLTEMGFEEKLCIYSYQHGHGKPSPALFELLLKRLADESIKPHECLYIGNDQRNDIWPAHELGCATALFAGDQRSLRLRQDDHRCALINPDVIITELEQLGVVLGF